MLHEGAAPIRTSMLCPQCFFLLLHLESLYPFFKTQFQVPFSHAACISQLCAAWQNTPKYNGFKKLFLTRFWFISVVPLNWAELDGSHFAELTHGPAVRVAGGWGLTGLRWPQPRWLSCAPSYVFCLSVCLNNKHLFLTVSGSGSLRPGCQHGRALVRAPFQGADSQLHFVASCGGKNTEKSGLSYL